MFGSTFTREPMSGSRQPVVVR